ncbi:MAG: hypothetical protein K9M57_10470 [Phycisphaerae bacterium]|nr:hypothetical protein [Phycisphaerae bacterium]
MTDNDNNLVGRWELAKLAGQAILVVSVTGLIVFFAAGPWIDESPGAVKALVTSGVICLMAALVSMVPLAIAHQRRADWLPQACLGGTTIRLLLTLTVSMIFFTAVMEEKVENFFAIVTVCFYLTLLMWETFTAIKFAKRLYKTRLSC